MKLLESLSQLAHQSIKTHPLEVISPDELLVLGFFLLAVVAVAVAFIFTLCKLLWLRGDISRLNRIDRAVSLAAVLGLGCGAYAYFVEPYSLEVTHIAIPTSKLKVGARPIRLALISDLHCDPETRTEGSLPGVLASTKPDVIFFAGDAINSPQALPVFRRVARSIAQVAPTYAVRGNHDVRQWRFIDLYKGTGVHELNGQALPVQAGGSTVWLAGVAVDAESKIAPALATIPKDAFSIFLYHFPAQVYNIAKQKVDLFCTGHTHGGQVRLPLYGAIVTRSRVGKQFEAGSYKVDDMWMYVNRGIGMEGGICPRVRFLAKPEITLIEIVPQTMTANSNAAKPF